MERENPCAELRLWVMRNARGLERSLWDAEFEGGDRQRVLRELAAYQNPDGGFGHALEPDNWNPASSPYTTLYAGRLLHGLGLASASEPLFAGILRYLAFGDARESYGWRFTLPSNRDYPCAPWWCMTEEDAAESVGLTAELCALLLRTADADSPLYATALALARESVTLLFREDGSGEMGVGGWLALAEVLTERPLPGFDTPAICRRAVSRANDAMVRQPDRWASHCPRPSRYIQSPESLCYPGNEAAVETELDWLLDTRPRGEAWPLDWSWFDRGAAYPGQWAISQNWWKSITALENLRFLRAFGRI